MPQKSVSTVCSRTTLANLSAPSPVIWLNPTLHKTRVKNRKTSGFIDSRRTVCYSVLERDQDRILFEIICQKHGVPNFEAVVR